MSARQRDVNPLWSPHDLTVILPALAKHLLDMVPVDNSTRVLDLASGSGTCALAFAEHAGIVSAVDISSKQVDACHAQVEALGVGNVEVHLEDAAHLSFPNGTFDLVTGTGALSNFDEPGKALAEAHRVLKSDGLLTLGDFLLPRHAQEVWGVLSALKYGSRRPYLDYFQVVDLLLDACFEIVQYRPVRWMYPIRSMDKRDLPEALKERYYQAVQDMDAPTKQALRLQQHDGEWVVVHDCFALVAAKFDERPRWQYEDRLEGKRAESV